MRRVFLLFAVLLAFLVAQAAEDPPKGTRLTAKEIADGWILLFDGETTYGWTVPEGDKYTIKDGMLAPQEGNKGVLLTTTQFGDYELHFDYQAKKGGKAQMLVSCDREVKPLKFNEGKLAPPGDKGDVMILEPMGAGWHHATVVVKSGQIREQRIESGGAGSGSGRPTGPNEKTQAGHLGFAGQGFVIRNLRLRPLGTQSLFNGKDLTGWKEFKGDAARSKSKFTVTKEGWLNIKDGPGDLQTEAQYADFVLQLECISNGKHLNSGVFFRCRPGEYQQGYEAQIRNQFTAEPTQKYTIEEYDPKSGELKGKKEITSTAFDYGTGAIYRRMPARREMSKDGEWFTMTVVANGRHLATWVNGIQVADWTDNRPLKDNARAGCMLEKGPISLQGHDPTTDLSFRNFRIAELPAVEKK